MEHYAVTGFADIVHACSEVMQEILRGSNPDAWDKDLGVLMVNDPERPGKKIRVYFNALDETLLNADEEAEKRGQFQAVVDLIGQALVADAEKICTEFTRVCSIWICMDQNGPEGINGTISRYQAKKCSPIDGFNSTIEDNTVVYVVRLWNFAPDAICQNAKDELLVTMRQLYDVLI